MNDIFTKRWFIYTVVTWIVVLLLDEVAYYWWRKLNPGSMWTGLLIKHPTVDQPSDPTNSYPNGPRPAGGI